MRKLKVILSIIKIIVGITAVCSLPTVIAMWLGIFGMSDITIASTLVFWLSTLSYVAVSIDHKLRLQRKIEEKDAKAIENAENIEKVNDAVRKAFKAASDKIKKEEEK